MSQNGSNMRRAKDVDQDDPYALHIHPTSFPPLEHGNYAHSKWHVIFMSTFNIWVCTAVSRCANAQLFLLGWMERK